MPSIVSSCSTVAVPRLIGPSSLLAAAAPAAAGAALRDDDLLTVGEPGGAVDRFQLGAGRGAAGPPDRVLDAAAGRQAGRRRGARPRR